MKSEFLDFIAFLEKTIASFYEQMTRDTEFERIKSVLEFMETHSLEHAEKIEELNRSIERPELSRELIIDYQNNLTQNVKKEVSRNKNIPEVLKTLADSEEALALLYKKVGTLMNDIADYYKRIASEIQVLAEDEYQHRDLLLKDRDRMLHRK